MAATLRLMRLGRKGRPFYRIIVVDKRKKRNGKYLEGLGTYNPLTEPAEFKINRERLNYWQDKGAQVSEGLDRLLKHHIKKTAK